MSAPSDRKQQISKAKRPTKNVGKKAHAIMARTHVPHARLLKIVDSYSRWMTVKEAAERSGVSRVTVGRIFNHIRERLLDVGIFESEKSYREGRYDAENEDGAYFFEDEWRAAFDGFMGRYRGIDTDNRRLYEAEAVFRLNNPHATPAEIRSYIMLSVRRLGPLNEQPETLALELYVLEERFRRQMNHAFDLLRAVVNRGSIERFKTDKPWITGRIVSGDKRNRE